MRVCCVFVYRAVGCAGGSRHTQWPRLYWMTECLPALLSWSGTCQAELVSTPPLSALSVAECTTTYLVVAECTWW